MNAMRIAGVLEYLCSLLSLSLLHFVWQGALVAVAGVATAAALRQASPSSRYRIFLITMLVMAACPIGTMLLLHTLRSQPPVQQPIVFLTDVPAGTIPRAQGRPATLPSEAVIPDTADGRMPRHVIVPIDPESDPAVVRPSAEQIRASKNGAVLLRASHATPPSGYETQIVVIYLLGVALMLARLGLGLQSAAALGNLAKPIESEDVLAMLQRKARLLGVKVVPRLASSARVVAPCVIGVLRPMILVPAAMLNGLSPQQVAAILAHELAHIRRYDHWFSLIQRLVEAVLFFHPAVWWISRHLSREREMCCDDLVIESGDSRTVYAESLLRVAELCRSARINMTLTATGHPSDLRRRVARMLGVPLPSQEFVPHRRWVALLSVPMLLATLSVLSLVSSPAGAQSQDPKLVFEDDFEQGAKAQWTDTTVSTTPKGERKFLGPFGPQTLQLKLADLPEHRFVRISFDLLGLRTMDGNDPGHGPDLLALITDDQRVLYCTTIGWYQTQAFPGYFGVHSSPAATAAIEKGTMGYSQNADDRDGIFHLECVFPHEGAAVALRFLSLTQTDINDEGWGLDNVRVTLDGVTPPDASVLSALWEQLGSEDGARAVAASDQLIAAGDKSVEFFADKLKGATIPAHLELLRPFQTYLRTEVRGLRDQFMIPDAAQRRTVMVAHVLQVIGTPKAKEALVRIPQTMPEGQKTVRIVSKEIGTGNPAPFVPIWITVSGAINGTVCTDVNGVAELQVPIASVRSFALNMNTAHYVPITFSWSSQSNAPAPDTIELPMDPGVSVGGVVVDDAGTPIEGAGVNIQFSKVFDSPFVRLNTRYNWLGVRTDKDGIWTFPNAPTKFEGARIGVYDPKHQLNSGGFYDIREYKELDKLRAGQAEHVLARGVPIEGEVYGPDGKPIFGAAVGWGQDRVASNAIPEQTTDAQGKFVFGGKTGDNAFLTVKAKGMAPELKTVRIGPGPQPTKVRFDLQPAATITGKVVDSSGKGVAGASIYLDTWRGARTLDTTLTTDADGNFTWPSAPTDAVRVDAGKTGYAMSRGNTIKTGQENIIKLNSPTQVKGTVIDAATGQPIEKFTIVSGIDWKQANRPITWERRTNTDPQTSGKNGKFELSMGEPYPARIVRIEAEGYLPEDSPSFELDGSIRTLEFKLQKGQSLNGVVRDPQGNPAATVELYQLVGAVGLQIQNGKAIASSARTSPYVRSAADGSFSFSPQKDEFVVVAIADAGFAKVTSSDLRTSNGQIQLQPWATIEGDVKVGSNPAKNTLLMGFYDSPTPANRTQPQVSSQISSESTDANGHFRLERVMPGTLRLGRRVEVGNQSYTMANPVRIEAKAGEVARVQIGGAGRPVTGRIVMPASLINVQWVAAGAALRTKIDPPAVPTPENYVQMSREEKQAWYDHWRLSEEGKKYEAASRAVQEKAQNYPIAIQPDGTFRIEDVSAGFYELRASFAPPITARAPGQTVTQLASAAATVTIPPITAEQMEEPFVIPDVTAIALKNVNVGEMAPAFNVPSLDGKQIKLEDYRGKYVLLDFWAVWCGPCIEEIPHYQKVIQEFGKNDKFVMISLSLDPKIEDPKKFTEKEKMNWVQGFLGEWSADKITPEYGVRSIPSVWLIDPEGKVVAKDLRGEAIAQELRRVLPRP